MIVFREQSNLSDGSLTFAQEKKNKKIQTCATGFHSDVQSCLFSTAARLAERWWQFTLSGSNRRKKTLSLAQYLSFYHSYNYNIVLGPHSLLFEFECFWLDVLPVSHLSLLSSRSLISEIWLLNSAALRL